MRIKSHFLYFSVLALLIAVWTTGCGGAPTAVAPDDEPVATRSADSLKLRGGEDSAITPEPTSEEATMTPILTPEPAGVTPPPEAEQVVRLAKEDLANSMALSIQDVRVVSVEAMNWSDASLGCPQPGMMYAQVITPGFLVVLEADGQKYEYHTDTEDQVVLCQPEEGGAGAAPGLAPAEEDEPPAVRQAPAEAKQVVKMAVADLAERLGLAADTFQLVSVEAQNWRDSSLGCPQPGMMYAQVITPGFLVVLKAEGQEYEYHTDQGRLAVLCEE